MSKQSLKNNSSPINNKNIVQKNEKKTIFDIPQIRTLLHKHSMKSIEIGGGGGGRSKSGGAGGGTSSSSSSTSLSRGTFKELDRRCKVIKQKLLLRKQAAPKNIVDHRIEMKTQLEQRLLNSDQELAELLQDGEELITNIRVANDRREMDRRAKDSTEREQIIQDLQDESVRAAAKINMITERWSELNSLKDPMALYEGFEHQTMKILDLMKQKDDIIEKLNQHLKLTDERYYLDQEKQNIDIECLVERIDAQIMVMKNSYRQHLELLQMTIDKTGEQLNDEYQKKWTNLYAYRAESELEKIEKEREQKAINDLELKRIAIEHEELVRATRIQLEQDNDSLLCDMERVKAEVQLNTEKLDYNYQIIQKRADENIIIRNQQKRRLGKLNETLSNLRVKIQETKQSGQHEIDHLTQDIGKLQLNILNLEQKSINFAEINDKKYQNVWQINELEANELINEILKFDRLFYEQQLGLDWERPLLKLRLKSELPSYRNAMKIINNNNNNNNADKSIDNNKLLVTAVSGKNKNKTDQNWIDNDFIREMIKQITNNTEWLMDDKLNELLTPYSNNSNNNNDTNNKQNEKILIKIDSVFAALNIQNIEQVNLLYKYFLPYASCSNCSIDEVDDDKKNQTISNCNVPKTNNNNNNTDQVDDASSLLPMESPSGTSSASSSSSSSASSIINTNINSLTNDNDSLLEIVQQIDKKTMELKMTSNGKFYDDDRHLSTAPINNCKNHTLTIDSKYILIALREYIENNNNGLDNNNNKIITIDERLANKNQTLSRLLTNDDVQQFWKRYRDIFPKTKLSLWNALEKGLIQYLEVLKKREKLTKDSEFLRKQNMELKHLLQRYLPK